jgi:PST family polysaccharide transporter
MLSRKLSFDILSLYLAHGARYIFILALLPFLARVLTPETFGILLFFQSLALIFTQALEYGFSFFGTRVISQNLKDEIFLSKYLTNVLTSQAIIFIVGLIIFSFIYTITSQSHSVKLIFWVTMMSLFQGISLYWFLRGIGKAILVAKLELFSKSVSLILILCFVGSKDDLILVFVFIALGNFVSFVATLIYLQKTISMTTPNFISALKLLIDGWNAFLIRAGGSVISEGNVLLAGVLLSPAQYGMFAGAYRIIAAVRGLFLPLIDAIFPYFTKSVTNTSIQSLVNRLFPLMVVFGCVLSILIYTFSTGIVNIVLGDSYHTSVVYLEVFACLPLIISLVHTFGTQWLVVIGKESTYSKIVIFSGLSGLLLNLLLTPYFGIYGAIIAILFSYSCIATITTIYYFYKYK